MFYFSLGILILTEGAVAFGGRSFVVRYIRYIFIGTIILIFGLLSFQVWQQYQVWSGNGLSEFFLPPHRPISYFLGYSFTHFFKNHLISLGAALLFLLAAILLNNRFQKRFFEDGELYLGALAIFLASHPLWIFYVIAIFSIGLVGTLIFRLKWPRERFPFYYLWLPTAIVIVIIGRILV